MCACVREEVARSFGNPVTSTAKFERNYSKAPGIPESTQRAEPADGGKGYTEGSEDR